MASWGGHTLPGTFFIIFGIYYAIRYSKKYFKTRSRSRTSDDLGKFYCCGKLPCSVLVVEGCVKIFCISVGTLVELFYPGAPMGQLHDENGQFKGPMNWQHATMYLFFGLSGVADIISYTARGIVPKGFDRIIGAVALFVEGYLFHFHLDGRSMIDTRCHVLLVLAVWPCALIAFLEAFFMTKKNILHILEMTHSCLLIFQGIWFWQVAYILYPPHGERWDPCFSEGQMDSNNEHSHNNGTESTCDEGLEHLNMMFVTMFFTWGLALVIIFVGILYALVYKWVKFRRMLDPSFTRDYSELTAIKSEQRNGRLLSEEEDEAAF